MGSPFPFQDWAKPGRDAFEFWISFFPTAPLFGVEWRFKDMVGPAANPLMPSAVNPFLVPMPGMRAAAAASKPGELDTPATADEREAQTATKAAEAAGDAARDAARIAAETGKAAARTAGNTARAGTEGAEVAVDTSGDSPERVADLAEKTGADAARSADEALSSDAAAAVEGSEATDEVAGRRDQELAGTPSEAATAVERLAASVEAAGEEPSDIVEHAIAAAPKPEMLLSEQPERTDDLKQLKGVGTGLERQLNALGVWRLDQIAQMSDADLAWIDAHLTNFKGRCFRDDWVGQARARLAH